MIIASVLTNIFGIFVFLFIFWKRLREDYSSDTIFKTASVMMLGITVGYFVSLKIFPPAFFWFELIGSLISLIFVVFGFKLKFFETFEAFVISAFPWMGFVFLFDSVVKSSSTSFLAFVAMLFFVFISYYLDTHYKNFVWYKSGKIGFAGIATLGLFFLVRCLLAIFGIGVISFVSLSLESIISGVSTFICIVLLVILSRTKE